MLEKFITPKSVVVKYKMANVQYLHENSPHILCFWTSIQVKNPS